MHVRAASRIFRAAAPAALLAAGLVAPAAVAWMSGKTLIWFDTKALYAPARWLVGSALREGRLPLWNPYAGTGMPLFAETVHGVLHPVSVASALLFRGDSLDPLIGGYVLSAGAGAAVLARLLGASRPASFAAAFAYGLSGFTLSMAGNLVFLAGAGSVPWGVAGVLAAARGGARGLVVGALSVAVCAFSGDIQGFAVAAALGAALSFAEGGHRAAVRAVGAIVAGAAAAGVQLVPSLVHVIHSTRAAPVAKSAGVWAFAPARLVELFVPGWFFTPEDGFWSPAFSALSGEPSNQSPFAASVHVGAAVLLLAAFGARTPLGRALLDSAGVLTWLALGRLLGAEQLLVYVPLIGGFRFAEKYVGPLTLCLSVLAALGIDAIVAHERRARFAAWAGALLAASGVAVWLGVWAHARWWPSSGGSVAEIVLARLRAGLPWPIAALTLVAATIALAVRGARSIAAATLAAVVWVHAAAASSFALRPGTPDARSGVPAPAPLREAAGSPAHRVLNIGYMHHRPPAAGWDVRDQEAFDGQAISSPNYNVAQRIDNVRAYSGIEPERYALLREHFPLPGDGWSLARRFGVTHAVLVPMIPPERAGAALAGGTLVGVDPRTGAGVWTVSHRPWAEFPASVIAVPDVAAAARQLRAAYDRGDPAAVIETVAPLATTAGVVTAVGRELERAWVVAEAPQDGILLVNEAYSPGWKARIDGIEVPLLAADVLVRAVRWPSGRHTLEMTYEPVEIALGATVSIVAVLVTGALAAVGLRRRRAMARDARTDTPVPS